MKKTTKIIYIVVFFAAILAPLLLTLGGIKSPNYEKRTLAEAPVLVTEEGINKAYTQDFDDYFSDNFALRPYFVTAYAKLVSGVFGTSVSPKVVIGQNDFLYFSETLPTYQGQDLLTDEELKQICEKLKRHQDALEAQGKAFFFTVAPDKNTIYPEYMPSRYVRYTGESNMTRLLAKMNEYGIHTVDMTDALMQAKQVDQVYHNWDTHWNNFGAVVGYTEMMKKTAELVAGDTSVDFINMDYTKANTHTGDLFTMLYPASGKKDVQMVYSFEKTYTSERPIVNLEALEIVTENENADTRALIFRDSFFNALIPFFSESFSYVQYNRGVPYDFGLAESTDADVVILEIVERNIPLLLENIQ